VVWIIALVENMKKPSVDNIEQFLKEIEILKAKVTVLEKYETNSNGGASNLNFSELKSLTWVENSPVCTKIIDSDFNLQYMSKAGIEKLKIDDITEFYGMPYPLYFYSDSFKVPMKKCLEEVKVSGEILTQEASILDKEGNELWFNSTLIPINNNQGKLDYFMVVSTETTNRKIAEIKLFESEEKLKEALKITGLGTFIFYDDTDIFETSAKTDEILGIDKSYKRDIQGWINLAHPEDYENAQSLLDNTTLESVSSEFRIIRPNDKKIIWVLGHAKKEFNKNGIRTKITGTIQDISERKEAENSLKQSEQRLNEAQAAAHIGSFQNNLDSDEIWWSETMFDLFGLDSKESELKNKWYTQIIHPDDKEDYLNALKSFIKSGSNGSFKTEFRGKHTSGEWLYFEAIAKINYDNNGKIFGTRGTIQDITTRKKIEKQLKKNQAFNESLLKTSPDIIYVYDLIKQKNIYNNGGNSKVLGYTDKEFSAFGKNLATSLLHPVDYKYYIDKILPQYQLLKENEVFKYESRFKHKNGTWRWLNIKEIIFKRKNGKVIEIFGIAGDITERKIAEEKFKEVQSNLKNTFDISPSIISKASLVTGHFIEVNAALTRILGFTTKEFMSKPLVEFIHPEDRQRTFDEIEQKLKGNTTVYFENRYLCKDGSYKWMSWHSSAPDKNGIVTAIGSDIDDKKQNERDLKLSADRFERWKSSNFIGVLQSNAQGDIVDANDTILNMLGYSKQELKAGKLDWTKLTPPEFLHLDKKAIKEAEKKGFWTPFEKEYIHKNGRRVPILIGGSLFKETQNEFIVFVINLTDNKKIEKELKKSEEFLNLTGAMAKVGGWELDLLSNSLKWSLETKKIHDVTEDYEPSLNTALDFYCTDNKSFVKDLVVDAIENGKTFDFEAKITSAKGIEKFVKANGQPVFKRGKCIRLFGTLQDITERKKIDKELEDYRKQLETENVFLKKEIALAFNYEDMVYISEDISNVLTQVEQVSCTDATVLILGETGTGKELIAKAIHNTSKRKNSPLIRVNCAAIPSELIESELFGHIKGSFTGAIDNRIGKFELAGGGTLFLDEIGELPLALQPKLLRAIQEGEIEPIGSSKTRKLDVRIIAATNKDLKKEASEKRFREDLFFRLNVFPITVPPLRNRTEDISVLIEHFVSKYSKKHGKDIKYISDVTLQQMKSYNWPGNVRELENLIERAVIISNQDVLIFQEFDNSPLKKTTIKNHGTTLNEVQRNHILKILNETEWKIDGKNGTAELLDIKPSTLRDRMNKLGIKRR